MKTAARLVVVAFCVLLVWAGLGPLISPDPQAATSQAPAYAWFHLAAAAAGLVLALWRSGRGAGWFALTFGLVDLYQAGASVAGWFPKSYFDWRPADDQLHLVVGFLLLVFGAAALFVLRRKP